MASTDAPTTPRGNERASRAALRAQALAAATQWRDAAVADLETLAQAAGAHGRDRAVVMYGKLNVDPQDYDDLEDDEVCEELDRVAIASSQGLITLTPGPSSPLWAELVQVWDDLRQALSHSLGLFVPVSLVVDLDGHLIAAYEFVYCPDGPGPFPELIVDLTAPVPGTGDPFDELLAGVNIDQDYESMDARIEEVLLTHGLPAPGVPAHAPGKCVDDQDD